VPGVVLDIDGYRDAQRQGLFVEAEEALDRVRETGEPVVLRPMNPFERAAVHSRVAEEEGFTSESAGLPPMRSVVVSRETSDGAVR
ncbi:MAG: R3H domain-containing nucleic acid-binding protein, partial [Corynebacterium kroppenstedtii]|nr:R3H domain-containing nucleic acid-binding protein [Corynebacterium kroppenstedtii]